MRSEFPELFALSIKLAAMIAEMGEFGRGCWSWTLKWKKILSTSELEQANLSCTIICEVHLKQSASDKRRWNCEADGNYSTKSAKTVIDIILLSCNLSLF
jgi:hypothetical protein